MKKLSIFALAAVAALAACKKDDAANGDSVGTATDTAATAPAPTTAPMTPAATDTSMAPAAGTTTDTTGAMAPAAGTTDTTKKDTTKKM